MSSSVQWDEIIGFLCDFCDLFCTAPNHPPAGVRVTLIEEDTALISWREPSEPNEVITHYTILYASQSAWMDGKWQRIQREG